MYDFSASVLSIIESIKRRSESLDIHTIGSEFLLIEMMTIEDGIFKFLMNEYDVKEQEVIEETKNLLVLRKENGEYSKALLEIFDVASKVSYGKIKEEHLLYGILEVKESIALRIIMNLGLSPRDLLLDLKEIYDFKELKCNDIKYTTNISKKAKNNELDGLYEYDNYLKKLEVILNKKYKNNPLIVGEAGVGKTALVEGFAQYSLKNGLDYEILSLNLSQMLSNTKYRGDFEARIEETLDYIKSQKNIILFIDEVHTIVGAGSSENSLDVANILKPFLARSDIKIIGATTLDEYQKTIYKDKALRRRFDPLLIKEPDLKTTTNILFGIKESYENYHKVSIGDVELNYLIKESDQRILNKARPDKCIDILDETMSYSRTNHLEISKELIDTVLDEHVGFKKEKSILHFKELKKLEFLRENNLNEQHNYNYHIAIYENDKALSKLKLDLKSLYGITEEMTLELDLKQYKDYANIQTLIGSPPGYVGYDDEGLLSRQIMKYPSTLLILKNLDCMSVAFKMLYNRILGDGYFHDSKGEKIYTKHVILLEVIKRMDIKGVGFLKQRIEKELPYDLVIEDKNEVLTLNEEYEKIISKYELPLKLGLNIDAKHKAAVNDIIYELINNEDKNPHEIIIKNEKVVLI